MRLTTQSTVARHTSNTPSEDGLSHEGYDRLYSDPNPDAGGKDFIEVLNPDNPKVVTTYVEPSLAAAKPDQEFQFERFGCFVADRVDHVAEAKQVFNWVTRLKDSWGK